VRSCFVLILRLWSTSCLRCLSGRCTVGFAVFGTRGVSTCVTAHFSYTDYRYNYSRTLSCKPLRRVCLCLLTAVENMGGLGASLGFVFRLRPLASSCDERCRRGDGAELQPNDSRSVLDIFVSYSELFKFFELHKE